MGANDRYSYAYFYDGNYVCIILDKNYGGRVRLAGYFTCEKVIYHQEGSSSPVKRLEKSELEEFCRMYHGKFEPPVRRKGS